MGALLLLLLLPACEGARDLPRVVDASATCDEAEDAWRLEVGVEHDGGPDRIVSVFVDLALLFVDEDFTDTQFIGSHELGEQEPGRWVAGLPAGTTSLQCGFDGDYLLTITVEDDDGDQAARQLQIDGWGTPRP